MCSKIFVKIHAVLRKLWSCAQLPMCPITHVPHHPRYPISIFDINHDTPLPMCPIAHVSCCPYVKKMSSCQKDVKLSKRCQMSKSQTHGLWRRFTKKINWHNEVHTYWRQFWCHIWGWPKTLKMCTESVFEQFWWPSYLMSKLMSMCEPHYVNLFFLWTSSIVCVWLFDIWHLFDILTSFWHFDIFFNLNHLGPSQGHFLKFHLQFDHLTFWYNFKWLRLLIFVLRWSQP